MIPKLLLKCILILIILSCGSNEMADGFGSETTNGTVAVAIIGSSDSVNHLYEVTLIPLAFNPINDNADSLVRDTTDSDGFISMTHSVPASYNVIARALNDTLQEKIMIPNVAVLATNPVSISDTIKPTGNVIVVYTDDTQINPYSIFIPGTEITVDGHEAVIINDSTVHITINNLPAGKMSPFYLWDYDYKVEYKTTDSVTVISDSTVKVDALL